MYIQIFGMGFIFITAIVILMDLFPILKDWLQRIHIGRYDHKGAWNHAITNQGIKWLNQTPKIKVTDNTRLVLIDVLKGNYSKSAIQSWQEGALLLGLSEYLKYHDDTETKESIIRYLDTKFDETGNWISKPQHIDGAILAYAVLKLDFFDPATKYKKAFDYIWDLIRDHIGKDGTVMYRTFMNDYRYVDTIGFICPFLVSYGLQYNHEECIQLAFDQIKEYEKYGMHKEHFIPIHAYSIDHKMPLGLYGWGRGLGWFAIGLMDAWNELPPMHKYKNTLDDSVRKLARSILKFQQESGCWNWTISRRECRGDSSTTATLCWFLLNAAKLDDIYHDCLKSSEKAIEYLMKVTRRNGSIDFSQGDTKDIGVYSSIFNVLPFTQGFSVRSIHYYLNVAVKKQVKNIS